MPVTEVSALGAVVGLQGELKRHEYADVTIELEDKDPLTLSAHVVNVRSMVVHLRWLHFEPGEEAALGLQLAKLFKGVDGIAEEQSAGEEFAWRQEQGTRRVTRPRSDANPMEEATTDRVTRHIMRPKKQQVRSSTAEKPDAKPTSSAALEANSEPDKYAAAGARPATDAVQAKGPEKESAGSDKPDQSPKSETKRESTSWRERAVPTTKDESEHVALLTTSGMKRSKPSPEGTLPGSTKHADAESRKILSRSRTVQASELAARHDKVRVLNMSTIKELIKESVAEAMVDINIGLSSDRLAEEVEKRVDQQLKAFKAEKQDAQAQAQRLEEELANAKTAIERERKRAIEASSFTVSETGMTDIERRLERLVNAAIRQNGVNDTLADELRGMVTNILDVERDRIAENAKKSQADTIELLKRKISRLSSSLEETQKARDRQQRTLAAIEQRGGVGLRNVMTAGLADDDPDLERKKALMKEIIAENRSMREGYVAKHSELSGRKRPAAAAAEAVAETQPAGVAAEDSSVDEVSAEETVASESTEAVAEVAEDPQLSESEESGDVEIDPDDLPWDGSSISSECADPDSPVKKITVSIRDAAAKAPPLSIVRRSTDDDTADGSAVDQHDRLQTEVSNDESPAADHDDEVVTASPEIDPDDLPWEGPPELQNPKNPHLKLKKLFP